MKIARGSWQESILKELRRNKEITSPMKHLRGYAQRYQTKYEQSFYNLLQRAKAAGMWIERIPGPRGGEWSARYILIKDII
jgi:hypothetical protein